MCATRALDGGQIWLLATTRKKNAEIAYKACCRALAPALAWQARYKTLAVAIAPSNPIKTHECTSANFYTDYEQNISSHQNPYLKDIPTRWPTRFPTP